MNGQLPITPPVGLTGEARAAWTSAVQFAPKGLLTATDHSLLERWARNYAIYRKLSKQVESADGMFGTDPDGNEFTREPFKMMLKVQAVLAQCEKELGFTPVSRARVRVEPPKDEEKNPFIE